MISDHVADLITTFRSLPGAKASLVTKHVIRELLGLDPQQRTRIRFSLMPAETALLDIRTSPMAQRLETVATGAETLAERRGQRPVPLAAQAALPPAVHRTGGAQSPVVPDPVRVLSELCSC